MIVKWYEAMMELFRVLNMVFNLIDSPLKGFKI